MNNVEPKRMARREAMKVILAATALLPTLTWAAGANSSETLAAGTLTDPDVMNPIVPWELVLTKEELRTVRTLCDIIIPEDEKSPSAGKLGVADFIDEWVSAPFPTQQDHQKVLREGLVWLNGESKTRFGKEFADLSEEQKTQICDDICFEPKAKPEFKTGAHFFALARNLTSTGFYTTREGMKDLQYVGNVALVEFKGPPREVLERLEIRES